MANAYRDRVLRIVSVAMGSVRGDKGRSCASWKEDAGPGAMLGHAEDSEEERARDTSSPVKRTRGSRSRILRKIESLEKRLGEGDC